MERRVSWQANSQVYAYASVRFFDFISLLPENESAHLAENLEIASHTIVLQHYEIIMDFQLLSPKLAPLGLS
jgi:hypothetical protein